MSSDTDASAIAATVALFDSLYAGEYCAAAASVLFIYDAFITFDREVAFFWTTKRTGASLLFLANKWISIALYVMVLIDFASFPSDKSCSLFGTATYAMSILQFVPGAAFSALRAFVLSKSKLLGLLIFVLSLAPVAGNLVHYGYQFSGVRFPPFGCLGTDNTPARLGIWLVIISRAPLVAADILLVWITWTTLRVGVALRAIPQSRRLSLSDILFCGGIIFFVVLFILNTLHLALSLTAVTAEGTSGGSIVTELTGPITAILISRFLLDLQEANQTVIRLDPDDPLHSSRSLSDTPSFIASLGGFINPDFPARVNDGLESHSSSLRFDIEDGSEVASASSLST